MLWLGSGQAGQGQANERPWPLVIRLVGRLFVQRDSAYQDVTVAEQGTEDAGNLRAFFFRGGVRGWGWD